MATKRDIDFGVLDPATTEVYGADDGHFVLLRSQAGGERGWPYPPEVIQRRDNTVHAELAVTVRVSPERASCIDWGAEEIRNLGPGNGFATAHSALRHEVADADAFSPDKLNHLELVLIKMLRPAAPKGVEWNAPGGVVELGEDPTGGMLREFAAEAKGMRILGASTLWPYLQFVSGTFRESYGISVVLAVGDPRISQKEGALEWKVIALPQALETCLEWNAQDRGNADYCGVDGKIIMALQAVWVMARIS